MTEKSFEVQQAVYDALVTAGVAGGQVYDHVPQKTTFPYVVVGEASAQSDDLSETDGVAEFLAIHIWSRYRGMKEIKQIAGAIYAALHQQNLTVSGRSSALTWVRDGSSFLDPDGLTRHGVNRVEVIHRT